ncbi:MAG: hypothetical protein H7Y31_01755 [Chitinophagaceae bacterium]|nr:hypothetical protein [Chitinophagaceae bacterium]
MKKGLLSLIVIAIVCLSMQLNNREREIDTAVNRIAELQQKDIHSLDSFLKEYPRYFYDSSYKTRSEKYYQLTYYFKRASGAMIYAEPDKYYRDLVGPFQFERQKRAGFFSFIPDNWLFVGPIGNERDSTLMKFSKDDSLSQISFIKEASAEFHKAILDINQTIQSARKSPAETFHALRTEIFRISALDVANSDFILDDLLLHSIRGSTDSWIAYAGVFFETAIPRSSLLFQRWKQVTGDTKSYLAETTTFEQFNQMYFIRSSLIPLSTLLTDLQKELKIPFAKKWAAVSPAATHIYDRNIFNADYFAPDSIGYYSEAKARLGELLFFDPILSDNNQRACASCHKPELAFTDGLVKATAIEMKNVHARNSPTVINSGFQKKTFWDQRAGSLEDQLDSVVNNPDELHSSFDQVADRIQSSPEYVALFNKAFPSTKKNGIGRQEIKSAIGVYERTVTGLNSRFDQYMQGDVSKLNSEEVNGFNIYMGKAHCGTCHFAPLFNGALPPFFDLTDHHSIGVPLKDSMETYSIDPDTGFSKLTGDPFVHFSFKTPTIRNIALTAPYMHNGVYRSLEQVVDFYNHAGGNKFFDDFKPGMKGLPFVTLIPIELKLTDKEKKDLIAFLKALTDTTFSRTPKHLPQLKGKYAGINKRKIGGDY